MFRPLKMSKVEITVPEHAVLPVTEALARSEVFHPVDTNPVKEDAAPLPASWRSQSAALTDLERRVLEMMESLEIEVEPPPEDLHPIDISAAKQDVSDLEEEVKEAIQGRREALDQLEELSKYAHHLEPVEDLDIQLDTLHHLRYTFILIGVMPEANISRLQSSLDLVPFVLTPLRYDGNLVTVMLIGRQEDAKILNRAARSAYLNPLELPEQYKGTPKEILLALRRDITLSQQHVQEWEDDIRHLHNVHKQHLAVLLWRIRARRTLVSTIASYRKLRFLYLITGWVPSEQVAKLEDGVLTVTDQALIEVSPPSWQERKTVPIALGNPSFMDSFQDLVTTYAYPHYGEIDPTPLVALSFPFIYGIMFGDAGHGIFLALLGWLLLSRKVPILRGLAGLGRLMIACGSAATLFGFLYGSVFGFEDVLPALWLKPMDDIMTILIATVGIGMGLISVGMICNIVNAVWMRDWSKLLFDHNGIAGFIFYWSIVGWSASALLPGFPLPGWPFVALLTITGLAMLFAEPLGNLLQKHKPLVEEGLATYLIESAVEFFESVIGVLSNTLSYVRMGAFAVAHGSLSLVVFIIAKLIAPSQSGFWYWTTVVLGNLFIIGFEGLIVGIQTLRLEYYEFFSKFFDGGGERYRPLKLVSQQD